MFFDFLPLDLHICLLQTWIGGDQSDGRDGQLLKALSALDIACCCSVKQRKHWLELAGRLHCKGMVSTIKHTLCYMHWLASRNVAATCLVLNDWSVLPDRPAFALPAVTELIVAPLVDHITLQHVLASCPNLTSIRSRADQDFWETLQAHHPAIRLEALSGVSSDAAHGALLAHGQHLLKLELAVTDQSQWSSAAILAASPGSCPRLESLTLTDCYVSLPGLLVALRAWNLTELVLQPYKLVEVRTVADVAAVAMSILEACRLKRFTITVEFLASKDMQEQAFVQLLAAHPELDLLVFQSCSYCRTTRYLRCLLPNNNAAESMRTVCADVKPLSLCIASSPQLLAMVVHGCPSLRALELGYFRCAEAFQTIRIVCCKQLQSLNIGFGHHPSDDDMASVLAGLPCLKELKICTTSRITFLTLQAIVDNKRCLDRFCCGGRGFFSSSDVSRFRQMAKEAGILPVPLIGPYH